MIAEYFLINSNKEIANPNFYCFKDAIEVSGEINKIFYNKDCHWSSGRSVNGLMIFGTYKNSIAEIGITIDKAQSNLPYVCHITILGGSNPLSELARLCKTNSWSAYNTKTRSYLDLNNPPTIGITEKERDAYYEDELTSARERMRKRNNKENASKPIQAKTNYIQKKKAWWQFWK